MQGRPALADQGDVPGAARTRPTATARSASRRAVALRVHQHVHRGGVAARSTSATTSPPRARSSGAARSPTSTRARTTTGSTTRTTPARRCCSSRAARTTSCRRRSSSPTPSTTRRTRSPRSRSSPGPHLLPAAPGLGGGRRRRPRLGARARDAAERGVSRRDRGSTPHRRADGPHRGRRLAAADRPDVRPARPALPVRLGHGVAQARRARRSRPPTLGPIDAVLLTHDHHDDNLDPAGPGAAPVGGRRGHHGVRAPSASAAAPAASRRGQTTGSRRAGRPTIEITATPCRHGPPLSRPIVGDVVGFALRSEGQEHGALWISGDTVLYDGVREVADRLTVDIALLHLGGVRFPVTGPVRYTMTARRGGRAAAARCGRASRSRSTTRAGSTSARAATRSSARSPNAPDDVRERVRWLPIGAAVEIEGNPATRA